jgi:hypothetical protein
MPISKKTVDSGDRVRSVSYFLNSRHVRKYEVGVVNSKCHVLGNKARVQEASASNFVPLDLKRSGVKNSVYVYIYVCVCVR